MLVVEKLLVKHPDVWCLLILSWPAFRVLGDGVANVYLRSSWVAYSIGSPNGVSGDVKTSSAAAWLAIGMILLKMRCRFRKLVLRKRVLFIITMLMLYMIHVCKNTPMLKYFFQLAFLKLVWLCQVNSSWHWFLAPKTLASFKSQAWIRSLR